MTSEPESKTGRHRILSPNYHQTFVYVFLVFVMLFALGLDQNNRANDDEERCLAGVDSRNVQRATVEAVYLLATGFIDEDRPPQTPEERIETNRFIKQVNEFRRDMYEQIKPSDFCRSYVDDDNVKPPSPDVPLFPAPPTQ